MKKTLITAILLTALLLTGCADSSQKETIQTSEQDYEYAVTGQLEINEYTRIITDVYYDEIETVGETEFYNGTPYISIQNVETGRICAAAKIPTGMVSQGGARSPKQINIKLFKLSDSDIEPIVIAVAVPYSEEEYDLVFYQFYDDLYGIYPLNCDFVMPMHTETADFDTMEYVGDNVLVCGDFSFEISLEPYPGSVKMSA